MKNENTADRAKRILSDRIKKSYRLWSMSLSVKTSILYIIAIISFLYLASNIGSIFTFKVLIGLLFFVYSASHITERKAKANTYFRCWKLIHNEFDEEDEDQESDLFDKFLREES